MKSLLRRAIYGIAPALCLGPAVASAAEPAYPAKPIRIVVPQTAGASTDLTARLVGQKLSEAFRQPVVVDNRPGAGSITGTDLVAKATPDGNSPEAFGAILKSETAKWAKVIKTAGIKAD